MREGSISNIEEIYAIGSSGSRLLRDRKESWEKDPCGMPLISPKRGAEYERYKIEASRMDPNMLRGFIAGYKAAMDDQNSLMTSRSQREMRMRAYQEVLNLRSSIDLLSGSGS